MGIISRSMMGVVCGALLVAGAARAQDKAPRFPDVPQTHWAFDAVQQLADRGVLKGYPDGTFSGGRAVTRQEMAVALQRFLLDTQKEIERYEKSLANLPPPPTGPAGKQGPAGNPGPRGEVGPMGPVGKAPEEWAELLSEQIKLRESFIGTQSSFAALRDELRALRARLSAIQLKLAPADTRVQKIEKVAPRAPLGL